MGIKRGPAGTEDITPVGGNVFPDLGFPPDEAAARQAITNRITAEMPAVKEEMMVKLMDDLAGRCLECGGKLFFIDTNGAVDCAGNVVVVDVAPLKFWAYCDACNHTCCFADMPNEVAEQWNEQQRLASLSHKLSAEHAAFNEAIGASLGDGLDAANETGKR